MNVFDLLSILVIVAVVLRLLLFFLTWLVGLYVLSKLYPRRPGASRRGDPTARFSSSASWPFSRRSSSPIRPRRWQTPRSIIRNSPERTPRYLNTHECQSNKPPETSSISLDRLLAKLTRDEDGKARADTLSPEQRQESASRAAQVRRRQGPSMVAFVDCFVGSGNLEPF